MASVLSQAFFHDIDAAYIKLESIIWPNGAICPRCNTGDRMKRLGGKSTRPGLWKCYGCRQQTRATVGTVFHSSHVTLCQWLQAAYLLCSSKKGISSNQLARTLGVTVKTGWFVSHRLREAVKNGTLPPMGGIGEVVEIEETFIGRKPGAEVRRGCAHKNAVLTLVQRGGSSRSFHVDGTKASDVLPIIKANIAAGTHIMTDEAGQYAHLNKHFTEHDFVRHGKGEYGRGVVHTNTVEGFYSVFKRGMKGVYQHCSEKHLHRYVAEFDFRYNNRIRLGVDDADRTTVMLRGIVGRRLTYKAPVGGA